MNSTQRFNVSQSNPTVNEIFNNHGGWDSINLSQNHLIFILCTIAAIFHFQIWVQLFIHKTKFDLSFIFPLSYILTDVFIILSCFIQYSIRIRSWILITPLFCYFEAYSALYFNLFEPYSLAALNIFRYWQIVRNQNIYKSHRQKVILISIVLPLLVLINMIIQHVFGWCIVIEQPGASCTLSYTNIGIRIWNLAVVLMIPIFTSFYMLFRSLYFLRNYHAQQMILRRNHHHKLIIHSFTFYSMWLSLWSPWMIIIYLDNNDINESIVFVASIANTLETLIDPGITFFLDQRFARAWQKTFTYIKRKINHPMNIRVYPIV